MGIALLKKLNAMLPDPIKCAFAPIIRRKLIGNQVFLHQYQLLCEADNLSEAEIQQKQTKLLKDTLIHAYEHTVFYHQHFDKVGFDPYNFTGFDDIKKIPEIEKQDIIEHLDEMQADDITDYYMATTGGSTGTPLKVYLDRESIYKERAFVYHFWSKFGYDYKTSRNASFRGTDFNGKICKYNPLYNEIQMDPCGISNETVEQYYVKMNKFGVEFLHGFPSAIYNFCKFAKAKGIDLSYKYKAVFLISENVYDFQREFIEETLCCPVAPFYGHSERAVFAEAAGKEYHFHPLYGYTEIGEDGHVICTGFITCRTPIIRYALDDTAKSSGEHYAITGHRQGMIYGNGGVTVSAAALEVHSSVLDKIANYQIVQDTLGEFVVRVIPVNEFKETDLNAVQELFQNKVGAAFTVTAEAVHELEVTNRGKYKLLVQKYKPM